MSTDPLADRIADVLPPEAKVWAFVAAEAAREHYGPIVNAATALVEAVEPYSSALEVSHPSVDLEAMHGRLVTALAATEPSDTEGDA